MGEGEGGVDVLKGTRQARCMARASEPPIRPQPINARRLNMAFIR